MKNIAAIRCHTFKQHVILQSGDKDTCLDNKPYEMIMNKGGGVRMRENEYRGEERWENIDI